MSYELVWTAEQVGRAIRAERLAAAERYRLLRAVPGSYQSPRTRLAKALRTLASLLDGEGDVNTSPQPDRRLIRAC
jgi:hypothetical protein